MIRNTVFLVAGIWLACAVAAAAQTIDNGTEVRVNPVAGGGNVLLYPGGHYMRVVPQLLQPGQTAAPVRLHLPVKRSGRARPPEGAVAAAPPAQRKPKPAPKLAAAAPPSSGYTPGPDFGSMPAGGGLFRYTGPATSAPAPKPAPATQLARAEPPPGETTVPGLTKQSIILFAHDAADPADSALSNIKLLAAQLNAAMIGPNSRVQIHAYGGSKGDKGSDARRLSLKRALAIRQVLIDDGVPAERIDVRAMGGVDDSGPADRVDVYTKA